MSYLSDLRLAVINRDLKKLEYLASKEVEYENIEEAKEINAYLKAAIEILKEEKNNVSLEMQKVKNLKKFYMQEKKESFNFKI